MKVSLTDLAEESTHNGTVFKKSLLQLSSKRGTVVSYNYAWLLTSMEISPHVHTDGEEYYVFLAGEGEMLLGSEWMQVKKDDVILVPQDAFHSVKNSGSEKLVFMTLRIVYPSSK